MADRITYVGLDVHKDGHRRGRWRRAACAARFGIMAASPTRRRPWSGWFASSARRGWKRPGMKVFSFASFAY